ncbi:MAG: manganese efflux pump [Clostridia bacterium]|nr:manganese efflux pump [Clostridia bacterium]
MTFSELFFLSLALSMDAFAISVCTGIKNKNGKYFISALMFGLFQGLMPILGYILGIGLRDIICSYDHWISFILLSYVGGKMIYSAFEGDVDSVDGASISDILISAVASSLDALAVGITFSFFEINIIYSSIFIAAVTYILSITGVFVGRAFGDKCKGRAELMGGIILFIIGLKILFEHLGIIT